ncbi:hypothetical protein [Emergencia timonensis]|uniref:hypothetical protein n=1 Tax=Emergencia timonensis TaxID=1776384 RepID=UPI003992A0B7
MTLDEQMRLDREKAFDEGKIQEKIETARRMKAEGIETVLICKITGLSIEEIDNL